MTPSWRPDGVSCVSAERRSPILCSLAHQQEGFSALLYKPTSEEHTEGSERLVREHDLRSVPEIACSTCARAKQEG